MEIGKDFQEKFSGVKANIFCLGREIPELDYDTDFWIQIKSMGKAMRKKETTFSDLYEYLIK